MCDRRGDRCILEFSVLSTHFCGEPKTAWGKRQLINIKNTEQTIHNLKVLAVYCYDKDDSTMIELPVFYPYSIVQTQQQISKEQQNVYASVFSP